MSHWLCISSDYNNIHISLCSADKVVMTHAIDKKHGNQRLLTDIDIMLMQHKLKLNDLTFIGVNLGPAPYTSLRIAIATVNGLHTATGIPLVGIDALKAFVQGHIPPDNDHVTVAVLNAFNNDLFYAIARHDGTVQTGYEKAATLHERLARELSGLKIRWIGNGAPESTVDYPSQDRLAIYAWQRWLDRETTNLALPLYLKQIT